MPVLLVALVYSVFMVIWFMSSDYRNNETNQTDKMNQTTPLRPPLPHRPDQPDEPNEQATSSPLGPTLGEYRLSDREQIGILQGRETSQGVQNGYCGLAQIQTARN